MKKYTYDEIKDSDLVIYKYIRGSHAYGLNTPESDIDTAFIYLEPIEQILGLGKDYQDQISDEKHDNIGYSIKKYFNMLLNSNPTVLESLFIPDRCILIEHPIMKRIKQYRDKFITKQCFKPFSSYAIEQIKKARGLNKKIVNPITERLTPLDFCYTTYKQGSTKINNWLEHRGMNQKYCGLVNIPNMENMHGVYYDWGNQFINCDITYQYLYEAMLNTKEEDTIELIHKLKTDKTLSEDEIVDINGYVTYIQFGNMARFICELYNVNFEDGSFEKWFNDQISNPIGFRGICGEDMLSNELRLSSIPKESKAVCTINYNKNSYSQHCKQYKEYKDWEKNRNPVRYESNLNKNYDSKNMCHCFRLVQMCIEIARGEGVKLDRTNIDREFLLNIRNHKYEYDELIKIVEEKEKEMYDAISKSTLPDEIDINFVNNLLIEIRKEQIEKYEF